MIEEFRYPEFRTPLTTHGTIDESQLPLIRVNNLLIRPYNTSNKTESGLLLARSVTPPPIWGHVLALHPALHAYTYPTVLVPGDFVLYHRHAEEVVTTVLAQEGEEKLDVCIIHIDSVQAILRPTPAPMRT